MYYSKIHVATATMLKSPASVIRPDLAGLKDQDTDAHLLTLYYLPGLTLKFGGGRRRNS